MGSRNAHDVEVLADTVWAERHVVEFLLYKLVTAKLLLAADERRFVSTAMDEVERVLLVLRQAEERRAAALAVVAASWGVAPEDLTLGELADRVPAPLRSVFKDHHRAFLKLTEEIEETSRTNRRLASAGLAHVRTALGALAGPEVPETYTASGRPAAPVTAPMRLDRVL